MVLVTVHHYAIAHGFAQFGAAKLIGEIHQRDVTQTGIPILSGIPIIGGLFGSADRRKTETELYLFLTPRII